jgi:heme A synthase
MKNLIGGMLLFAFAQSLIWIQTNGQFVWPWFKRNPLLISIMGGTIISYIFIKGTAMVADHFDGQLWPGRFIGQATGIVIFATMTFLLLNEGINTKTSVSLMLAILLLCVQIFWK